MESLGSRCCPCLWPRVRHGPPTIFDGACIDDRFGQTQQPSYCSRRSRRKSVRIAPLSFAARVSLTLLSPRLAAKPVFRFRTAFGQVAARFHIEWARSAVIHRANSMNRLANGRFMADPAPGVRQNDATHLPSSTLRLGHGGGPAPHASATTIRRNFSRSLSDTGDCVPERELPGPNSPRRRRSAERPKESKPAPFALAQIALADPLEAAGRVAFFGRHPIGAPMVQGRRGVEAVSGHAPR